MTPERLSDVPDAPLHVVVRSVVKSEQTPDDLQVFYEYGSLGRQEIKNFYMEEMERLGWRLNFEFEGAELLLEFIKPNGMLCIISFRNKNSFVMTMIKKKDMLE